eukprot:GCRY01003236.1.p1 GENE.GCRY01003236.1~~GCRY01003236.1.p1  ORF type:complete len:465 (-),score=150.62 GCRY01003236.1:8-1402(-)
MDALRKKYAEAGQEQVFSCLDKITDQKKMDDFLQELKEYDLKYIEDIYKLSIEEMKNAHAISNLEPPKSVLESFNSSPEDIESWKKIAFECMKKGEVGVVLMAGGQGTRLGFNYPKGQYDIGLPSKSSLFQRQAEQILKLQQLSGGVIPWYIMTSDATDFHTQQFFEENKFFGLEPQNVMFFKQGKLPILTTEGKIILQEPGKIASGPDGNGGIYRAMKEKGVLADMARRGVQYVHVYGVDNALVKVADPAFLGSAIDAHSDCAVKVVPKSYPTEAVGVVCVADGQNRVVEYSEFNAEKAAEVDSNGKLLFDCANIANHFFTTDFLVRMTSPEITSNLSYHVAFKKTPHLGADGATIAPSQPNAYKLELFIFDTFPYAKNLHIFSVLREQEFAPVKNAPGAAKDTPESALRLIAQLHTQYIQKAGGTVQGADPVVEISPLVSYEGEGLEPLVKNISFTSPVHLH